jgi:aspartyl-tRNA(Asn)/glutamyl-tRNA(Gln) amidotransferase subunit A
LKKLIRKFRGYLSRDFAAAQRIAENADVLLPLGGVPVAIKDVINVRGEHCGCGSQILRGYTASYDATAIARLRAAGAIPFGRTNMDEFAMGSSTENSSYFPTLNPWDGTRIPGGSSGGSAAVVAADEAFARFGHRHRWIDPATGCALRLRRRKAQLRARLAFRTRGVCVLARPDRAVDPKRCATPRCCSTSSPAATRRIPRASTCRCPITPRCSVRDLRGVKLGMPREYFIEGIDPQVDAAVRAAVRKYEELGAEIVEVSLPNTEHAVGVYYIVATAEASANLARFDGVRYGRRAEGASGLIDQYGRTREEGFGAEVKRRIILGTYVLSSGYYDAYYLRAQKVRTLIRDDFTRAFEKVDALICPTSPEVAFKIGERSDDPLKMYLADIFTIAANLAGHLRDQPAVRFRGGRRSETPDRLATAGQALR